MRLRLNFLFVVIFVCIGFMKRSEASTLDLSIPHASVPTPFGEDPAFHYHYFDSAGNVADLNLFGLPLDANSFFITSGVLTVTGGADIGTYALTPGGPAVFLSAHGAFLTDNVLYPQSD